MIGNNSCSIPSCERPCKAFGYCNLHYQRWRRWGDPLVTKRTYYTGDRSRCSVPNCPRPYYGRGYCNSHWKRMWRTGSTKRQRAPAGSGYINTQGYRLIRRDGKQVYEHRVVWEEANGPIPEGYDVHHINDVPADNRLANLALMPHGAHMRLHCHKNPKLPRHRNSIHCKDF